jgi:GTP-binding protein
MPKFTDELTIKIRAGHGGPGCVAFRREKYIPKGGPDGGDGGRGGDVYFVASRSYYNLAHLFRDKTYSAKNGLPGQGGNKNGINGEDLIIKVPLGTEVLDAETGEPVCDLLEEDKPVKVLEGGIGGKGNTFYKSATNQGPQYAQHGMPGGEQYILLNLKLIADVGLVGLPNAGKSTLLSKITNAKPKIADYPFTTLVPNLGVVQRDSGFEFTIADIPGIIEGAHLGHGLGLSFLRHIERVRVILYMIEATEEDPKYVFELLQSEVKSYNKKLAHTPSCIIVSKTDCASEEQVKKSVKAFGKKKVIAISSETGDNLNVLIDEIESLLGK